MKRYLINIKGTTASMAGYNTSLQGNITGLGKVSSAIKQYNSLSTVGEKEQTAFATAVSITNGKLGNYLSGLNGSKASLNGYGISLISSTAKTIGLTVATTALNAALTMGISVIVSGIIAAFTKWINKTEEITQKAQEASEKISSINDNLKSNTETVENAKRRYAELAQEVENLGKVTQNQGSLNNEEYEEFLDLSNQLAGVFPSLTKHYDDNGNAILDLSGNVNTIVSSLDDLIQKEKEFANQKIMEEFPDVFKGWTQDLSNAGQKVKSAKTEFDKINNAYQQLSNGSTSQGFDLHYNGWFTNENGERVPLSMNEYISNLEELGLKYEKTQIKVKNQFGGDNITGYLIEAIGDIDTAFTSKLEAAREDLQYAQQQLEGEKSSINSYLNTWLQTEFSYNQIENSGLQTAIQDMLFNFDWNTLPENIDKNDWDAVSEYLRRNILFAINNVQDNKEISTALSEVFTNAELTPDEKANYLQQIQDYFGEDNIITISLKPQIDDTETLQKQYQQEIDSAKEKFNGYDPTTFFKEHSINTQEEIDAWQEIAQEARDAKEAEEEYIKSLESKKPDDNKRLSFSKILSDNDVDDYQKKLSSLESYLEKFKSGEFSSSDKTSLLMDFGIVADSADELSAKIQKLMDKVTNSIVADLKEILNGDNISEATRKKVYEYLRRTNKIWEHTKSTFPFEKAFLKAKCSYELDNI